LLKLEKHIKLEHNSVDRFVHFKNFVKEFFREIAHKIIEIRGILKMKLSITKVESDTE